MAMFGGGKAAAAPKYDPAHKDGRYVLRRAWGALDMRIRHGVFPWLQEELNYGAAKGWTVVSILRDGERDFLVTWDTGRPAPVAPSA